MEFNGIPNTSDALQNKIIMQNGLNFSLADPIVNCIRVKSSKYHVQINKTDTKLEHFKKYICINVNSKFVSILLSILV